MSANILSNEFDDFYNISNNAAPVYLEQLIYRYAEHLSNNVYNGGFWKSTKVENGDFKSWYFLLTDESIKFPVENNMKQTTNLVKNKLFSLIVLRFAIPDFLARYEKNISNEFRNELINFYDNLTVIAELELSDDERKIFTQVID